MLEALRQPLEDGHVTIVRAGRAETFPARFQLIAAMNPCPCGRAGVEGARCTCPRLVADRYADRISGPLRDRIDLWVAMPPVPPALLVGEERPESSAVVAERIARTRERQIAGRSRLNARLSGRALRTACRLTRATEARAVELAELDRLSARGTERLLRVARTIADMAAVDVVGNDALEEAARFRSPVPALERRMAV